MSSSNTSLRVTELDFGSIKNNLKEFLRNQSEFQDFDFDGSGMSVLLDVLAYNTHYMGYYLNVVANERFLDTAQLRSSVLSVAKQIGYTPLSAQGAMSQVTVRATPSGVEDTTINFITLDKYTRFLGEDIDGVNYPFIAINSNTASKVNGSFTFANVFIRQGEVNTVQYFVDPSNIDRRFTIPSENIDASTLTITVQESSSNTETVNYELAKDITEVTSNTAVYFLEENEDSKYSFYFGDGFIGRRPKTGNIVIATYLDTVGSRANNISRYTVIDPVGGFFLDNVTVTATSSSYGGTDKETIDQIRFRAPKAYTTQNRCVIDTDYETLIVKDYNNIDTVSVWGGEDNDPPIYGKVFISIKPKGFYFLSNLDKERIIDDLIKSRSVLTVIPEIIDPDYVFIMLRAKITYDTKLTSRTANEIKALVNAAILDYKDRELNQFSSIFRKSKLQTYIENAEPSITGSDIQVYAQKRIRLFPNETRNYEFAFNLPIKKGDYVDNLYSLPQIRVKDIENNFRDVFFEEVPNSFTGIDEITILNPGRNYLDPPNVIITGDGTGAVARAVIVNGKVDRIEIIQRGVNYTRATVSISGGGGREAIAVPKLGAKNGNIRTYYFKPNGEKIIVNPNIGTINYETGTVRLNTLMPFSVLRNDFYEEDIITINVPVGRENLYPLRNRILTLDENDSAAVQIEVTPDN
jgi:hypothetical protein